MSAEEVGQILDEIERESKDMMKYKKDRIESMLKMLREDIRLLTESNTVEDIIYNFEDVVEDICDLRDTFRRNTLIFDLSCDLIINVRNIVIQKLKGLRGD